MEREWYKVIKETGIDWNPTRTGTLKVGDYIQAIPRPEGYSHLCGKIFYRVYNPDRDGNQFDWTPANFVEKV